MARLQALQSYAILDTPAEEAYDQLATLAARLCSTPMAVVNFLDSERQWFKAAVGVPFRQTDRAISFCTHALSGTRAPMVVADARQHPLFAVNPLVVGEPHVRLYACVPLITPEGAALGTLAVLDTVPRALTDEQLEGLKILAGQVMVLLELRRQQRLLSQLVQERDQMHAEMLAQSLRIVRRSAEVQAARAQFYPNINLAGFVGLQSLGFGNLLRGGDNKNCHTAMWYETYYDRECADKRATGNFNLNWEIVDGLTATAQYAMHDYNYRGSYY